LARSATCFLSVHRLRLFLILYAIVNATTTLSIYLLSATYAEIASG
jgi:hypothetical protein